MSSKQIRGLLIYPPVQLLPEETPRPDGSLGLLYLASSLRNAGVETEVLDASVGAPHQTLQETFYRTVKQPNGLLRVGMQFEDIAQYAASRNYDFVGVSSNFTPQTRMVFETAKAIKEANPRIRIYAGGVNARALYERFLRTGLFDAVCLTEGELIVPRLASAEDPEKLLGIPGIAFLPQGGAPRVNAVNEDCFPACLDDLPMPAWDLAPLQRYEKLSSPHGVDLSKKPGKYAPIMTSRGCIYGCLYCHISTERRNSTTGDIGRLRTHSLERVIREVQRLQSLGVSRIFFEDDSLFAKKERAKKIFKELGRYSMDIVNVNGVNLADFFYGGDGRLGIDEEFIELLRSSGFSQIVFPVESGSQRVIDHYATGKVKLDRMNVVELMRYLTNKGIKSPVNLMMGFPDETEEEMRTTIELGRKLKDAGAPYVTFFVPIPFPGSRLYQMAISRGYLEEEFDTDRMNWKRPVMRNTLVSPERIMGIRDAANEEINSEGHLRRRLEESAGHRLALG